MKIFFTLLIAAIVSSSASATWLPPEELRNIKPTPATGPSNITETEFREIISTLQNLYAPTAQLYDAQLALSGDWRSETLNAGAMQTFNSWKVKITGGLARRPELTKDAFTLILCHELGHHFGGFAIAPGRTPFEKRWAANEGQADYFSTQVCARNLWINKTSENEASRKTATEKIRQTCDGVWQTHDDQNLCYRILSAVESMTNTMAAILKKPNPDFATPDTTVVDRTSHAHPAIQCRMDTTAQGALCQAVFNSNIIPGKNTPGGPDDIEAEKEAAVFSCTNYSNYSVGLRPSCWFKPRL